MVVSCWLWLLAVVGCGYWLLAVVGFIYWQLLGSSTDSCWFRLLRAFWVNTQFLNL